MKCGLEQGKQTSMLSRQSSAPVSVQKLKKAVFPGSKPSEDVLSSGYEEERERKDNRNGSVFLG
jgi:hypothetical protein